MSHFPKYSLTDKQLKGIANIVLHEQGTIAGWYAEASQIANRTDIKGDKYATGANAVKTVTSGWYAKGKSRFSEGTTNKTVISIVKMVFCHGLRTLPRYVDEHDCLSDIATVKNGIANVKAFKSKWVKHKTIIHNKMSSTYRFYSFPGGYKTGVDPFGYTSTSAREKWGDFCYSVENLEKVRRFFEWGDTMPILKKGSKGKAVQIWQIILGIVSTGNFDDFTEKKTKEFQKKKELTVDGIVGSFTWSAGLGTL